MNYEKPVELYQLKEQIKSVAEDIRQIKEAMSQIIILDKTMAELAIFSQLNQKNVDSLSLKYEDLKTKTTSVDHELKSFINRFKGGTLVLTLIGGAVQAGIFGFSIWIFSNVNDSTTTNRLQQQRIDQIERKMESFK